nr:unnamed protein product [Digitaria exilis]
MATAPPHRQQLSWLARMGAAFGPSFLCLVCLIYFIQGFRSFVWTAVSYQMKDMMKLSPSTSQFLVSLAFSHVGLAIISLLDIVLVSRLHVPYGIDDKYMVLWGSALADAINQFKMMPFLILSGQFCPPGIEGTLFALFMSINNFGSTLGSFLGAALASALDISAAQFDNLALGLGVQLIGTLLPIWFLFLIPKEVTGLTS